MRPRDFGEFFERAVGAAPFPFQRKFAEAAEPPQLVHIPTGLGKTAMAIVGWLWRRFGGDEGRRRATPRRLVYCLPMRVLVEQTRDNALLWLQNVGLLAGEAHFDERGGRKRLRSYAPDLGAPGRVAVHVLMGGEDEQEWDAYPECEAILVGTQDMLLSRALNRGYGVSRSRWPMQFGLLHTDALWVFDEVQLMGSGLATTAQLEALRGLLGDHQARGCRSVWMSATMQRDWLKTVDFASKVEELALLELSSEDHLRKDAGSRWEAKKPLEKAAATMGDAAAIAKEVLAAHKRGTRTIVVVNTVERAREVFEALGAAGGKGARRARKGRRGRPPQEGPAVPVGPQPRLILLHSRFRAEDRHRHAEEALAEIEPGEPGTILVSTQVVEAGVDVSATTLFTELAPWASLVQRFGRCNRRGGAREARVFWIDLPGRKVGAEKGAGSEKLARPYAADDLAASRKELEKLADVGSKHLPEVPLPFEHTHVIRRKDVIDLFDTTPDLAGNDIDIDRFVRAVEASDVRLFWRDYGANPNRTDGKEAEPAPRSEELCRVPVGELRKFAGDQKRAEKKIWRWNFLERRWDAVEAGRVVPGQVFLVSADAGGYTRERGWEADAQDRVDPVEPGVVMDGDVPDATEEDRLSRLDRWEAIAEHTDRVRAELDGILPKLGSLRAEEAAALHTAARWHDRGKAHEVFQDAIYDGEGVGPDSGQARGRERPPQWRGCRAVAKAPGRRRDGDGGVLDPGFWRWPPYTRRHFRHELASALAVLLSPRSLVPPPQRDLVAYLVAAHHGKVRVSIRSLPDEARPRGGGRFARGVWDGDRLPPTDLGGGVVAPLVTLSLEPMELGLCEQEPFAGQPSWAERTVRLRDRLGPFRLAHLEAILRAADWRASRRAGPR